MSPDRRIDRPDEELAAEYVLGVLPHAEREAFTVRLEHDEALQQEVRFWSNQLLPLVDEIEPVNPPARIFRNIEGRLFPARAEHQKDRARLSLWRGLAIISLAGLLLIAAYLVTFREAPSSVTPSYVAELEGETRAVRLIALFDPATGALRINRTEGTPGPGRAFELWLIEGSDNPVSLGVLPEMQTGVLTVPAALRGRFDGAVLAISDEPAGGSPTGQPTGDVLATGEVNQI